MDPLSFIYISVLKQEMELHDHKGHHYHLPQTGANGEALSHQKRFST